jgi:hypothetical protein
VSYVEATTPSGGNQASVEDITRGIDMTALLTGGQTVTNAAATLTGPNGNTITLTDSPTVVGNIVSQRIRAGVLAHSAGPVSSSTYTLTVTFTPSTSTNVFAAVFLLYCPF